VAAAAVAAAAAATVAVANNDQQRLLTTDSAFHDGADTRRMSKKQFELAFLHWIMDALTFELGLLNSFQRYAD